MDSFCYFDESLPRMVRVLVSELGRDQVSCGVVLRDATGCLAFFCDKDLPEEQVKRLRAELSTHLGSYLRPDRPVAGPSDWGVKEILSDQTIILLQVPVEQDYFEIRYYDRRIVGADWLRAYTETNFRSVRIVFSSLKGGVGRSTAISVIAAEQAKAGRNVLVVDLDLEAPGIGSMLLPDDRLPLYGVLDYLVERNLRPITSEEMGDFVGTSTMTTGAGLVDVVPVVGSKTNESPQNFLAKLSRGLIEGILPEGGTFSLSEKLQNMIEDLEAIRSYDLILIDVRAGLAEITAGPFLALGAEILLFGTAQPQTLQGLRFLFSHLSMIQLREKRSKGGFLKMVHAKATTAGSHERYQDDLWDLFSEFFYEEQEGLEGFNFDAKDPLAPHNPLSIPLDPAFADWDPILKPDQLVDSFYRRTFGDLLQYVDELLLPKNT